MNENNLLLERLRELPSNYKKALAEIDLPSRLTIIANEENLLLDQISEIEIQIILAILGFNSSDEFVSTISQKLNISNKKALSIANTVDAEIFTPIRESLRRQEDTEEDVPSEKSTESQANKETSTFVTPPTSPSEDPIESPEEILAHIENLPRIIPGQAAHNVPHIDIPAPKVEVAQQIPIQTSQKTEEKPVEKAVSPSSTSSPIAKKSYPIDPYREPIN